VFILVVVVLATPAVLFAAFGLYYGLDVPSGFRSFYATADPGNTIADSEVPRTRKTVTWTGDIENHLLSEASGLAVSSVDEELMFAMNDSGNDPQLFALRTDGSDLGFWTVDIDRNRDWEDLASFVYEGQPYLLIADTGDNFQWRPSIQMIVIKEPLPAELAMDAILPVAWQFSVTYPHGYRDSEAVAVDENSGSILILSKRRVPSEVYRVPLKPEADTVEAVRIALLTNIPQPTELDTWEDPEYGKYRSQPTALDIKDRLAVVVTYKDAYVFERRRRDDWSAAFSGKPHRIALPLTSQQEAGALSLDQDVLFVTTEREGGTNRAGIYRVEM
jgi:hypothetical protein